jgi:DinB superfamily
MSDINLSFPIGKVELKDSYTPQEIKNAIGYLEAFPTLLEAHIQHLDAAQLAMPYRPGGWTISQVVHHLADSHTHCLMRIKLALSEDKPTIKPYDQAATALLSDYDLPINYSTTMLHCIHKKIVHLFKHMSDENLHRTYIHPEYNKEYSLLHVLFTYEWHSKHHLAHVSMVNG